jgi:hypothetical protein
MIIAHLKSDSPPTHPYRISPGERLRLAPCQRSLNRRIS